MTDHENTRNGVQRNLFGTIPSDHPKTQECLIQEANRITVEKSQKWNFDFARFQPLPGRYKWERVGKRLQTRRSPTPNEKTAAELEHDNALHNLSATTYNLRKRERNYVGCIESDHTEANVQTSHVVELPDILTLKSAPQGTTFALNLKFIKYALIIHP